MQTIKTSQHFLLIAAALTLFSCKKDDDALPDPTPDPLEISIVNSLPPASDPNQPVYYSLERNEVVPESEANTSKWDIAFARTTILINSGTSGPGQGSAQVLIGIFEEIETAPLDGYRIDNAPESYAIPTGSGNGWYSYNPAANTINPIAGRVIVMKTASGKYAKLEMISYYKNAPSNPGSADEARHYTFRFSYQPDGSRTLK